MSRKQVELMLGATPLTEQELKELKLDPGIENAVRALNANGVETFESCEGGKGHAYPEPTVRFHGGRHEGFRALAIALEGGLHVDSLRRYWSIEDGEPVGPKWEMTFFPAGLIDNMGGFL